MPEGHETRRMAEGIARSLVNKNIIEFKFNHDSLTPIQDLDFISIIKVFSRGKAIVIRLDNGLSIISHNQLYGKWTFNFPQTRIKTNRQLRIEFSTKSKVVRLWSATDIKILRTKDELDHPYIKKLGPDILDAKTDEDIILSQLKSKKVFKRKLSSILLDQSVIAGLGNYLRSEILFFSGLMYTLRPIDLNEEEINKLSLEIKRVSIRAYLQKGKTLDFKIIKKLFGNVENFKRIKHMVFRRNDAPCFYCGTEIEKVIVGARGIFFCAVCQKGEGVF